MAFVLLFVACSPVPLDERAAIERAMRANGALEPLRGLAHLSHTCDLTIDDQRYAVVDVRELVRHAMTARGLNRIVILSPTLREVRHIEYTDERPLFCKGDRLYLWGDLRTDDASDEGNVLVFSAGGQRVRVERTDITELPIFGDER